MDTMSFSINVPVIPGMNIDYFKQKVQNYVRQLVDIEIKAADIDKKDDMSKALEFIDSLEIPGAKNIPLDAKGIEALISVKYA